MEKAHGEFGFCRFSHTHSDETTTPDTTRTRRTVDQLQQYITSPLVTGTAYSSARRKESTSCLPTRFPSRPPPRTSAASPRPRAAAASSSSSGIVFHRSPPSPPGHAKVRFLTTDSAPLLLKGATAALICGFMRLWLLVISTLGAVSLPVTFVGAELGCWAAVLGGLERRIWSLEGVGLRSSSPAGQSAIRSS